MLKQVLTVSCSLLAVAYTGLGYAEDCPSDSVCGKFINKTENYVAYTDTSGSPWYESGVSISLVKTPANEVPPGSDTFWQAKGPDYIGYGFNVYTKNGEWVAYCDATASAGGAGWANAKCDNPKLHITIEGKNAGRWKDNNYQVFTLKST